MKKRRGRKRKAGVARRPAGRADQLRQQPGESGGHAADRPGSARAGVGLSKSAAAIPESTALGRLVATSEISRRQYEAATAYAEIVR